MAYNKSCNKKTEMKFIILISVMLIIVLFSISQVSAYKRLCLVYGQSIPNAENPRYTCWHDQCQVCVTDLNNPARPSHCYDIEGCEAFGEYELDEIPPEINVLLPIEGGVYNSLAVTYEITSNEPATLSLTEDGINWRRLMSTTQYYKRDVSVKEGLNNVTIKARDRNGNEATINRKFIVDTRKPIITRTYPLSGFINSIFTIEYTEENINEIKLHYGNSDLGYQEALLQDCPSGSRQQCSIDVDLSDYDGNEIEYWFELKDIAGSAVESRKINVFVDESEPKIIDVQKDFNNRNLYLTIEVDEVFLQEVGYSYEDSRGRIIARRLCSRLDNGFCRGKVALRDGEYDIKIYATDFAGGKDELPTHLFIDNKAPVITRTNPIRGFANGDFSVDFREENPESLILYYGNELIGIGPAELIIDDDCTSDVRGYSCLINVDLTDYNNQQIEYWFVIEDKAGNTVESRHYILDVDSDSPDLVNDNPMPGFEDSFWFQGEGRYSRYIYFNMEINEKNFKDAAYSYEDSRGITRTIRLCTFLKDNKCERRVGFRIGHYDLDIQINDKAGNSYQTSIGFNVE